LPSAAAGGYIGVVGRPVVEHEDLQQRIVDAPGGHDRGGDHAGLVVGGDQDRHARPSAVRLLLIAALLEEAEQRPSGHPQRRGDDRVEPDEREQDDFSPPHSDAPGAHGPGEAR
jgi:hypothetical protein